MRVLQQVVQTLRLSRGVVHVDVPWINQFADDCGLVDTMSLVGSINGSGHEVCPVDVILKHSNKVDVVLTHNYRHTGQKNKKSQTALTYINS